uniref:Transglutaminase N-terminal domain-containing protein n=1 Tax=Malurus cyaneus samueli TaxID=2593467 RepID=A0A8C5UEZ0_9PASS
PFFASKKLFGPAPSPDRLLAPVKLRPGSSANRIAHHTQEFPQRPLVVRRGQRFHLGLILPRPLGDADEICVELTLGEGFGENSRHFGKIRGFGEKKVEKLKF